MSHHWLPRAVAPAVTEHPQMHSSVKVCSCASWQAMDKTFRLLPGHWHVLLKEDGNESILEEVIAWLKERV